MNNKLKEKEVENVTSNKTPQTSNLIPKEVLVARLARRETWQAAIKEMRNHSFESIDSALKMLVDLAIASLGPSYKDDSELHEFLIAAFETDQTMLDELKEAVLITT